MSDGVVAQPDAATWSWDTARQQIARIVRAMPRSAHRPAGAAAKPGNWCNTSRRLSEGPRQQGHRPQGIPHRRQALGNDLVPTAPEAGAEAFSQHGVVMLRGAMPATVLLPGRLAFHQFARLLGRDDWRWDRGLACNEVGPGRQWSRRGRFYRKLASALVGSLLEVSADSGRHLAAAEIVELGRRRARSRRSGGPRQSRRCVGADLSARRPHHPWSIHATLHDRLWHGLTPLQPPNSRRGAGCRAARPAGSDGLCRPPRRRARGGGLALLDGCACAWVRRRRHQKLRPRS